MASLDMSLDDVIQNKRNSRREARGFAGPQFGRGRLRPLRGGRIFGALRRNVLGLNVRPSAFSIAKSIRRTKTLPWHNGLVEDSIKAADLSGREVGTKLHISNLDIGVTNEDIRELFSEIGELVRYAVHFNRNGRPSGTAEVVFLRRSDAVQALRRYNNVQLDGRPMKVEIVGDNIQTAVSPRVNVVGGTNGPKRTVVMATAGPSIPRGGISAVNRTFGRARGRGGVRGGMAGRGRGRGRGGAQAQSQSQSLSRRGGRGGAQWVKKSAEELDKELDKYHAEAMES